MSDPINKREVNKLLKEVARLPAVQKLKITTKYALTSGVIVGASTAMGGMLGGPAGVVMGGILSSCGSYYFTKGKYTSAAEIIMNETTQQEKEKLAAAIWSCLNSKHIASIYEFVNRIKNDEELMMVIIQVLIAFLGSEMGRSVVA